MKNRVAVTGLGIVSPLGFGIKENWERVIKKEGAVAGGSFEGNHLLSHAMCGSVPEFDPGSFVTNKRILKLMNRESLLASAAAKLAMDDAHSNGCYTPEATGLFLGSGLTSGELGYLLPLIENSIDEDGKFSYELLGRKALPECNPLLSFKILPNMALSYISILFNIKGRNLAFNPWPGNTAQAICMAMHAIESGSISCALAGGCDSKNNFIGFTTFSNFGMLSDKGICSPFSSESDGIILSEGAAVLVLENYESAVKRGASIYAELSGYSTLTDPVSQGYFTSYSKTLEDVMGSAVADSGIETDKVDVIVSGAASIRQSDIAEASAISRIFGSSSPLITCTKPLTGDLLAASPAFDICLGSYSFSNGGMPPLLSNTDPDFHLNFSSYKKTDTILVNSFVPGRVKTSLLLRRPG